MRQDRTRQDRTCQDRRLALVTGAHRGPGLAIASALAQAGVQILLGCRSRERGHAAAAARPEGAWMEPVHLDVTDDWSIAALRELVRREYGRLDILVNAAEVALDARDDLLPRERFERSFAVNATGAAAVTEAMLPLLTRSEAPCVVNLLAAPGGGAPAYLASKAALEALTRAEAARLKGLGIKVNGIRPVSLPGPAGLRATAELARRYALLGPDGPSGTVAMAEPLALAG
ncbi:SDR family NAD(P)-dependent oxidoreductase [Pseudoroseomonas sp. WGS1072]|uniref:SDR family NAD(P)-dependent oxidoreductase n=1 Tax=Roseomonas sp. WGS1072 TaxID=3366816 RepID=UPI003BEFA073